MDRVGSDDVEFFRRGQHEVARIVVVDLRARIVFHVVVLRPEIFGRDGRNQRLHFADRDALNGGMQHERARRDAGSEAHDQHRLRVRWNSAGMWPSRRCRRMS